MVVLWAVRLLGGEIEASHFEFVNDANFFSKFNVVLGLDYTILSSKF